MYPRSFGLHKPHYLCQQFRYSELFLPDNDGNLPETKLPKANQGPALKVGLPKPNGLGPAVLTPFCTDTYHFCSHLSGQSRSYGKT